MPRKNQYIGGIIGADPVVEVPTDEHWDDVTLLLNGEADPPVDVSSASTALDVGSSVSQNTSIYKYGSGSLTFTDTVSAENNYISYSGPTLSGDFTVETWWRPDALPTANGTDEAIWETRAGSTSYPWLGYSGYQTAGANYPAICLYAESGFRIASTTSLSVDTWYHIALVRSGGTYELFVDGVSQGTWNNSTTLNATTHYIGRRWTAGGSVNYYSLNADLDDFRFTPGVARYTGPFDPPEASLPTAADPILSSGVSNLGALGGDGASTTKPTRRWGGITGRSLVERLVGANVIDHSLRFDGSGDYLSRSQDVPTEPEKWTWAGWVKLSTSSTDQQNLLGAGSSSNQGHLQLINNRFGVRKFTSVEDFAAYTSSTYTDTAVWTHFVLAYDSTLGSAYADDRVKIWVNGQLETTLVNSSGGAAIYPDQNETVSLNASSESHYISRRAHSSAYYFNGQLADVHFIDGQALTAADFGETNASGQWVPKEVTGLTYGSNGFYLPFSTPSSDTNAFNAVTYTGTGTTHNITGVGLQADMIWIKNRDYAASNTNYNHILMDSVRGKSGNEYLHVNPNVNWAEATFAGYGLTGIGTDGFTVTGNGGLSNATGNDYIAWTWKAGGAPTAINTSGTAGAPGQTPTSGSVMIDGAASTAQLPTADIYPTKMSVNTEAGFSIVEWSGTENDNGGNEAIPHGLNSAPELIMFKSLATGPWVVGSDYLGNTAGWNKQVYLNVPDSVATSSASFNNTAPTSSTFTVGASDATNDKPSSAGAASMIAYCWHSVPGYSKFGSYAGNYTSDNYVELGFKPAFVMVKATNNAQSWAIFDNARDPNNQTTQALRADMTNGDLTGSVLNVDFEATGFRLKGTDSLINNNYTYIYMAFADQSPNLGLDATTNSNNFTVPANTLTPDDQLLDSPNLRFASFDPTEVSATGLTFSEANLGVSNGTNTSWRGVRSDFSIPDYGKVYYEWVNPTGAELTMVGVTTAVPLQASWYPGFDINSWGAFQFSPGGYQMGWFYNQNSTAHTDTSYTIPAYAVGMVAVDRFNGKMHYGIDGQWWTSTTTLGTFQAYMPASNFPNIPNTGALYPAIGSIYSNSMQFDGVVNFGQDHTFAGSKSPLTSPFTDDDGNGEFYYEPPPGFKALATTVVASSDTLPTTGVLSLAEHYQTKL